MNPKKRRTLQNSVRKAMFFDNLFLPQCPRTVVALGAELFSLTVRGSPGRRPLGLE